MVVLARQGVLVVILMGFKFFPVYVVVGPELALLLCVPGDILGVNA